MNKTKYIFIALSFVVGVTIGSSANVIAQQTSIPSWVKNTALWWGQGQISDDEFIKALQWLINQGILQVPQSKQSVPTQNNSPFSDTTCTQDQFGFVKMSGKFTNGDTAYSSIFLTLGVLDNTGKVVATGSGIISNIQPFETKIFDAEAGYAGQFKSCEIQVDSRIP